MADQKVERDLPSPLRVDFDFPESKKVTFSFFMMKFHQKSMMGDEKIFVTPRGGLVRLFGLPWGFTSNQCASHQNKIFDQAHPHPAQNEKSKMSILGKNREKNFNF